MGGGRWDTDRYHTDTTTRRATKVDDFAYSKSATTINNSLDPTRINGKPFGKLESRDSVDHPESNAVLVCFDVTGSNHTRAIDAQKKLPNLMDLLGKYLSDPQVAVAANDDFHSVGKNCIQISDFESDNRIDEHIRNVWLTAQGGGNDGESYNLLLYAAARKTVLDCVEQRGKKGYLFLYADEPMFSTRAGGGLGGSNEIGPYVKAEEVLSVFGDTVETDIPISEIIEEARRLYHVFVMWPQGGYDHARDQFVELFGDESVVTLQHPNMICEQIGTIIGLNEEKISADDAVSDLVKAGTSPKLATDLVSTALATVTKVKDMTKASASLPALTGKKTGSARL